MYIAEPFLKNKNVRQRLKSTNTQATFSSNLSRKSTTVPKLRNFKSLVEKHWHILQVNSEFKEIFHVSPVIASDRNINLKQIIGINPFVSNAPFLYPQSTSENRKVLFMISIAKIDM